MSFTSIPNQPILFGSTDSGQCVDCGGGEHKQLVDFDDQLFFQVEAPVCGDKLAISNRNVEVWNEAARSVCGDADALGVYSFNFTALHPVSVFKFSIVITSMTAGELTISLEGGNSQTFYTAGTFDFYLQSNLVINGDFSPMVTITGASFIGCFNSGVEVYEVSTNLNVAWVDANTLEFEAVATNIMTIVDNVITVAIDMTTQEIGAGCHRLAITDSCDECIIDGLCNQELQTSGGCWTASSEDNWQLYPNGQATIDGDGLTPATYAFVNSTELCIGAEYTIHYTLTACEGGNSFRLQGFTGSAIRTAAGIYSETLIANGANLQFRAGIVGAGLVAVENLSVTRTASSLDYTQFSDVLSVGDYDNSCESMVIGGCNASDQFGFKFGGSSFLPSIRLEAKRFRPQYDFDVDAFRSASGKWTANYVDRLKKYTFHFRVNEQVLDFLSLVFYFDNCYINGQKYFPANDEFPQIQWDDADDKFGRLDIEMYLKEEKVTKVLCSASDADCLPSILDNGTENFLLTEGDERITTEGSVNILW